MYSAFDDVIDPIEPIEPIKHFMTVPDESPAVQRDEQQAGTEPILGAQDRVTGNCELRIIKHLEAWDKLEAEWKTLFAASPTASPPLRWEWLRTWWEIYGPEYGLCREGEDGLRILTVWRDALLVGALPLYIRRPRSRFAPRRLGFLSTGEQEWEETCAENLDLLHLPGAEQECVEAIRAYLDSTTEWDELDLTNIAHASPLACPQQLHLSSPDCAPESHEQCYVSDLSGGFEAYLQRLSRNGRSQARRAVKSAETEGVTFETASTAAQAHEMLTQLIALHQARWQAKGKPGVFASPRFEAFHRALVMQGVEQGHAILVRLALHGEPLALILGYCTPSKFDSYIHGTITEEREGVKSPGITALMLLHQLLLERGMTRCDYLSGDAYYKQMFSTETTPLWHLSVHRTTPRMAAQRLVETPRRAGKRLLLAAPSLWETSRLQTAEKLHNSALSLLTSQESLHGLALSLMVVQDLLPDF